MPMTYSNIQVFINPAVTALPEHHHLFAEPGCFTRNRDRSVVIRNCGYDASEDVLAVESKIPDEFIPIKLEQSMDDAWERLVFGKTLAEYQSEPKAETT